MSKFPLTVKLWDGSHFTAYPLRSHASVVGKKFVASSSHASIIDSKGRMRSTLITRQHTAINHWSQIMWLIEDACTLGLIDKKAFEQAKSRRAAAEQHRHNIDAAKEGLKALTDLGIAVPAHLRRRIEDTARAMKAAGYEL